MNSSAFKFIVATNPSTVAGYGVIGSWKGYKESEIISIAVKPRFQGQGIGQVLMSALIHWARKRKEDRIILTVRVSNHKAINLYKKNEFVISECVQDYYGQGEDGFRMTLLLSE